MKRLYISFIVLVLALSVSAQAPLSFKYQAYLRNADGTIRGNEFVTLQIKIVQGTINGASVYSEVHNTSTNSHGLIAVNVGDGSTSNNMSAIQWSAGPYFFDISVNGIYLGTTELLSVPFALWANETGDSFSGNYSDLTGAPNLARVATSGYYSDLTNIPSAFNPISHTHTESQITNLSHYTDADIDGSETAFDAWDKIAADDFSGSFNDLTDVPVNLDVDATDDFDGDFNSLINAPVQIGDLGGDMGGVTITNLLDPVNPQDAATMSYVDASAGFSGSYNDLTDVPTNIDEDATDDFDGDFNSLTNRPLQIGDLGGNMGNVVISNLANPTAAQDAATRAYVDLLEAQVVLLQAQVDALETTVGTLQSDLTALEARVFDLENP